MTWPLLPTTNHPVVTEWTLPLSYLCTDRNLPCNTMHHGNNRKLFYLYYIAVHKAPCFISIEIINERRRILDNEHNKYSCFIIDIYWSIHIQFMELKPIMDLIFSKPFCSMENWKQQDQGNNFFLISLFLNNAELKHSCVYNKSDVCLTLLHVWSC
jgi:hypothetical protein